MKKSGKNKAIAIKDPEDLKRMQNYLKYNNYKAYILFMLGLSTGYRGGDLIHLTVADIKRAIETEELNVYEGKTKNTRKVKQIRTVYLNTKLIKILKDYVVGMQDAEYIYSSQKGKGKGIYKKCIRRDSLGKEFKKAAVACGITDISIGTHTPRKTYGYIQYITHDKDINYVQELFGHSSPKITKAYIGIDDDILRESADVMDKYYS